MAEMSGYTIEHGLPGDEALADDDVGMHPSRAEQMRGSSRQGARRAGPAPIEVVIGNAAELRRMTFPPIRFVVPDYIAEGCTLLAGRPKLGKSWLVLEAGLAVASGGTCLGGIACDQGGVLYLALEDNRRRLQRRIDKLLGSFATEWPAAFEFATEWPRANEGGIDKIREWIAQRANPRLVIVDVLAMFKPVRGASESLYEADYAAIKGLQALAGEYGIAVVIVHHTRKSGTESDPFEKVSGTLGLSGAADTTLILDRDGNGATLYGRGRDIEEIESAVTFDKLGCRWFVQGEAKEVRRSDERGDVLALLSEADAPMSPAELAPLAGITGGAMRKRLHDMMKAGDILKAGTGKYVHPDRADLVTDRTPRTPGNTRNAGNSSGPHTAGQGGQVLPFKRSDPARGNTSGNTLDDAPGEAAEGDEGDLPADCYRVTGVTGGSGTDGSEPAPNGNDGGTAAADEPVSFDAVVAPMLDHLAEVAETSKARGTIVAAEPLRRSKRTNKQSVTIFTVSAISRGVKASVGPLVDLSDKLALAPPHERNIVADMLGRAARMVTRHGGTWPHWIAVVEGDHSKAGFPTSPDAFDAWFDGWASSPSKTIIGDWRAEARADGALDWLSRPRGNSDA